MLTTSAKSSFLFSDDGSSSTLDRFLAVFATERISLSSLRNEIENLTKSLSVKLSSYTCTCHPKLTILSTNPSTPKMDARIDPTRDDLASWFITFQDNFCDHKTPRLEGGSGVLSVIAILQQSSRYNGMSVSKSLC